MTRKYALLKAIDLLSQNEQNNEIVKKLQEILDELPSATWTKKSILDSIETYVLEHNNILPHTREMTTKNNLPSNTVIYKKFGISSMEIFFKTYFSNFTKKERSSSPYKLKSNEYFTNVFKDNYKKIQSELKLNYISSKTYDRYKEKNTPHTTTIIKNTNCKTYEDLLILCGYKKQKKEIETTISVSYNDTIEQMREFNRLLGNK